MASAGIQMILSPVDEAGPARRLALIGAASDLVAMRRLEQHLETLGIDEPLVSGEGGPRLRLAQALTVGGALGTAVVAVLLEARLATSNAASAFGVAFWCVLGLCGVALLAALRLPGPAPEGRDAGLTRAGSHHRPRRGRA